MELKLKIIFVITILVSIPTWFGKLYTPDEAWLIRDLSLMSQSLMLAVIIYSFIKNKYIKIFVLYLVIWRITGIMVICLEYTERVNEAMLLSYGMVVLFAISLLHLGLKWYYSTQRY